MQSSLVNFIQVLRTHEVRISPAETLDAVDVAATLGYSDRSLLREGLAMTLAKTPEEEVIFMHCFDRFFQHDLADFSAAEIAATVDGEVVPSPTANATQQAADFAAARVAALQLAAENNPTLQALLQTPLMQNLVNNDRSELTLAMNQAAERVGLRQIQMFTQKGQFTRRILDAMGEEQIRNAVISLEQARESRASQCCSATAIFCASRYGIMWSASICYTPRAKPDSSWTIS